MTLETGLRLIFAVGMLVVVVTQILVLQNRHKGQINATRGQKMLLVVAGGIAVIAGGLAFFV